MMLLIAFLAKNKTISLFWSGAKKSNIFQKVLDPMGTQGKPSLREFGNQVFDL